MLRFLTYSERQGSVTATTVIEPRSKRAWRARVATVGMESSPPTMVSSSEKQSHSREWIGLSHNNYLLSPYPMQRRLARRPFSNLRVLTTRHSASGLRLEAQREGVAGHLNGGRLTLVQRWSKSKPPNGRIDLWIAQALRTEADRKTWALILWGDVWVSAQPGWHQTARHMVRMTRTETLT